MKQFSFKEAALPDVKIIQPFFLEDDRGYFQKNFEKEIFAAAEIQEDIYEEFETLSNKGVLRGMHFQTRIPQAKLVRCIQGRIFDVVVDLRPASLAYGKWEGFWLDDENKYSLYVPRGFAHGFYVVTNKALVSYKCAGAYSKEEDTGIRWNDTEISIVWPLENGETPVISARDNNLMTFKEYNENMSKERLT